VTIVLVGLTSWLTARSPVGGAMSPPLRRSGPSAPSHPPVPAHVPVDQPLDQPDGRHAVAPVLGSIEALAVAVVEHDESDEYRKPAEPDHPDQPAEHRGPAAHSAHGPATSAGPRGPRHRTTLPGWCFLVAIVAALALENATTYWSTDLVREQTGAGPGIATATTAGLLVGMSGIRFVVGPLSLRVRAELLLAASFGVAIVGWAILWTATTPWVAVVGLFVAGLGYGAQYPLSISLLLATAPDAQDVAQSRATLAGGLAIGVAPFLLGALADEFGMHTAFVIVPIAAVLGGVAALAGGRAQRVR
jgi:hypothetical protein